VFGYDDLVWEGGGGVYLEGIGYVDLLEYVVFCECGVELEYGLG